MQVEKYNTAQNPKYVRSRITQITQLKIYKRDKVAGIFFAIFRWAGVRGGYILLL